MINLTRILLPYGRLEIQVEIPESNLLGVFSPQTFQSSADPDDLLQAALEEPIGTPRLRDIVRPGQKIAIVTSDLTRPTPSDRMLPWIARELQAAGIPDEAILIVLALGLHRPMTVAETEAALSPAIARRYRVINHDPQDTVHLGMTARGTPVDIFRPVVEADVRICLGNLEFHYFAGYSGGAKAILPGCASHRSINTNHSWMVKADAAAARIDDNPVRLDLEEGVAMLGVDFIMNVVMDGQHEIVGAVAGEVTQAHRAGCELVDRRGRVSVPRLGDIVIASTGGYPKDINFYQAHKALESAKYFVRPGGIIILLAECPEGFGHAVMERWLMEFTSADEILQEIQREFVLGGHKAAAIALIEKRASIYLVSSLPDAVVRRMRFTPFATLQSALDKALEVLGDSSQVIVLPQASSIIPRLVV
jgi:nickel-dependent lactate racemase